MNISRSARPERGGSRAKQHILCGRGGGLGRHSWQWPGTAVTILILPLLCWNHKRTEQTMIQSAAFSFTAIPSANIVGTFLKICRHCSVYPRMRRCLANTAPYTTINNHFCRKLCFSSCRVDRLAIAHSLINTPARHSTGIGQPTHGSFCTTDNRVV